MISRARSQRDAALCTRVKNHPNRIGPQVRRSQRILCRITPQIFTRVRDMIESYARFGSICRVGTATSSKTVGNTPHPTVVDSSHTDDHEDLGRIFHRIHTSGSARSLKKI